MYSRNLTTAKQTGNEGAERRGTPGEHRVTEAKRGNRIREIPLAVQVSPNTPALFEWSYLNILQRVERG